MTKTEILEAINNVIVSNDQKGITAEVLAGILTDIVNQGVSVVNIALEQTEAQRANNAKIYDALKGGAVLPLYVYSPDEATYFVVNMVGLTSNEIELYMSAPMNTNEGLVMGVLRVDLYPDGTFIIAEME